MIGKASGRHFLTCGAAEGPTRPNALDGALLQAGVGNVNLVRISSVVPPGSRFVEAAPLAAGTIVPAAYATITSELPGEVISAGVAVAYPRDESLPALIMEYSAAGHKEDIEAIVRRMAQESLARRDQAVGDIRSIAVQHKVKTLGTAFAAVVLGDGK